MASCFNINNDVKKLINLNGISLKCLYDKTSKFRDK